MKKLKLFALLGVMLGMASCSGDDEPANLSEKVVGNYEGYAVASCQYFSNQVSADQKLTIIPSEINKVDISYVSLTWGTITIEGASLSEANGSIAISGSGKSLMGHAGSEAKEYECNVAGTLNSGNIELTFSCPAIMGGLNIEFKQGEIPAEIVLPGNYTGYVEAKSAYFSGMYEDNQKITVAKNSDDTYKVSYVSESFGEFSIDNATVSYNKKNGKFELTGEGTTKMGMGGNVKDYACTLSGGVDPEKNDPVFTFTVPTVMGGLTIEFHTGDMPSAE